MKLFILFLTLLCASCTVHPTAYNPETKELYTLGASFWTKTKTEYATMTTPGGTTMSYFTEGKDETIVPNNYLRIKGVGILADANKARHEAEEATTRALGAQSVQKAGIAATKEVSLAKTAAEAAAAAAAPAIP